MASWEGRQPKVSPHKKSWNHKSILRWFHRKLCLLCEWKPLNLLITPTYRRWWSCKKTFKQHQKSSISRTFRVCYGKLHGLSPKPWRRLLGALPVVLRYDCFFVEGRMGNHPLSFQYILTRMRFELSWYKSEKPSYSWNLCTDFGADIFTMWPDDFRRFPQILGKWFEFLTLILCWSTYLAWVPQFLNHSSLGFFVGVFGRPCFFHEKSWGGHLIFSSCLR